MKGLYKKIGLGVLSAALVLGASVGPAFVANAQNKARHNCKYQVGNYSFVDQSFKSEKDARDEAKVKDYAQKFRYDVGPIAVDVSQASDLNGGFDGLYAGAEEFLSCVKKHKNEVLGEKYKNFGIGSHVYMIKLK